MTPLFSRIGAVALCCTLLGGASLKGVPTEDGLYATLAVDRGGTVVGEFTARLEFEKVPQTVANFVGLAEGTLSHVDFVNRRISKSPFYNGISFHRVVPGFVIQAGSPNGQGTDGPGYTFPDEFEPSLRHDQAGILSMANSGLNSNGSQFFVTLDATSHLDDVHSVFGEVVEGLNIVNSVQQGDVIREIRILRIGLAAQEFNSTEHGLPMVEDAQPTLAISGATYSLNYQQTPNSEYFIFHGPDVQNWNVVDGKELYGPNPTALPRNVTELTVGQSRQFFKTGRVQYAGDILTPGSVLETTLTLADSNGFELVLSQGEGLNGTYALTPQGQLAIVGATSNLRWDQEAYRGRYSAGISGLQIGSTLVYSIVLSFSFETETSGAYAGSFRDFLGQPISPALNGTFTFSTP